MEKVDCIVVGAGVIGLATARALALEGREVIVVEAAGTIGTVTSSRNSEVIHAGIYYPKDSLMARLCREGRRALCRYCADHGVPHRAIGKLIVATTPAEATRLDAIKARAQDNGVEGLIMLSGLEARQLEPELDCRAALLSAVTGILDSHAFMLALHGDAEAHGVAFAFQAPFLGARRRDGLIACTIGGAAPMTLGCRLLVNAAGLNAPKVADSITGLDPQAVPPGFFAKGNYFRSTVRPPFSHLIYPVPEPGGLGVHLTLDMAGEARFGPDVEWVDGEDYSVDPARAARLTE